MRIRRATENDAEALLKIYAPYVEHTAITFEYEVPSVEEFRSRIRHTLEKYPYLVAEEDGELLGYAYVGPFHDRPTTGRWKRRFMWMSGRYTKVLVENFTMHWNRC